MRIKAEIIFDIITDRNEYVVCDDIKATLGTIIDHKLHAIANDKSGESLFNISVIPVRK